MRVRCLPGGDVRRADGPSDRPHARRTPLLQQILAKITVALAARPAARLARKPKRFTTKTVYAIIDLRVHEAKPKQLAAWIRGHWHIENKVHWVRDVTYDEDRSQIRTGTGPQVMAALRNAAISALHATGVTDIAAANRYHARDSRRPLTVLGIA